MSGPDLFAILPLLVVAGGTVVVMLAIAIRRNHAITAGLTMLTLLAALGTTFWVAQGGTRPITPLAIIDRFALFYMALFFASSLAVAALAYDYFKTQLGEREEFYLLLLLATLGAAVLSASSHFASFFLGLELLSVSLYAMIAYRRHNPLSIEAGLKYLVLAGSSSAFLLFGMALVYAALGTMEFGPLASLSVEDGMPRVLVGLGAAMILVGVGFKLALVPFHFWAPDVYEGSPAPTTAFIATVSKGAMFAVLLRFFSSIQPDMSGPLPLAFALLAGFSMFVGNLLALRQNNVKRLLAYSSIAQMGYILVAFLAGGSVAVAAVTFYLVAYVVTSLAAFGVVSFLSGQKRDADEMSDYRGLAWQRPFPAAVLTVALLSLAGLPFTAGFIGKFYLLAAGVQASLWVLAAILVVNSAIGLYYYLRVVVAVYSPLPEAQPAPTTPRAAAVPLRAMSASVALSIVTLLVLWLGLYPTPLIRILGTLLGGAT